MNEKNEEKEELFFEVREGRDVMKAYITERGNGNLRIRVITDLEVPAGEEKQVYIPFKIPITFNTGIDVWRAKVGKKGVPSHHFILGYIDEEKKGDVESFIGGIHSLYSEEGLSLAVLMRTLAGSMWPEVEVKTEGIATPIVPAESLLVVNLHYVSSSEKDEIVRAEFEMELLPEEKICIFAVPELPQSHAIKIPPKSEGETSFEWEPKEDSAVVLMTSHFHQYGTKFEVEIIGEREHLFPDRETEPVDILKSADKRLGPVHFGEDEGKPSFSCAPSSPRTIYLNCDWEHPPIYVFKNPLVLRKGRNKLKVTCHYNNPTTRTITYGETARWNEMCIMPIFYFKLSEYEKVKDSPRCVEKRDMIE